MASVQALFLTENYGAKAKELPANTKRIAVHPCSQDQDLRWTLMVALEGIDLAHPIDLCYDQTTDYFAEAMAMMSIDTDVRVKRTLYLDENTFAVLAEYPYGRIGKDFRPHKQSPPPQALRDFIADNM